MCVFKHSILFRSEDITPEVSEAAFGDRRTLTSFSSLESFVSAQGDVSIFSMLNVFLGKWAVHSWLKVYCIKHFKLYFLIPWYGLSLCILIGVNGIFLEIGAFWIFGTNLFLKVSMCVRGLAPVLYGWESTLWGLIILFPYFSLLSTYFSSLFFHRVRNSISAIFSFSFLLIDWLSLKN